MKSTTKLPIKKTIYLSGKCSICQKARCYHSSRLNFDDALQKFLDDKKFFRLGSGAFASVYGHKKYPRKALKVFTHDRAYIIYLSWVIKNQHHKYSPKIYSIYKLASRTTKEFAYAIILERLSPCKGNKDIGDVVDIFRHRKYDKALIDFCFQLGQLMHDNGLHNDTYGNNVMMRGKTPVVTDPAC
jgi:hypothetical protein